MAISLFLFFFSNSELKVVWKGRSFKNKRIPSKVLWKLDEMIFNNGKPKPLTYKFTSIHVFQLVSWLLCSSVVVGGPIMTKESLFRSISRLIAIWSGQRELPITLRQKRNEKKIGCKTCKDSLIVKPSDRNILFLQCFEFFH